MLSVVVTFLATFVVAVLLLMVIGMRSRQEQKTALQRLETLTVAEPGQISPAEPVELRRQQTLSNIPFLNRILQRLQLGAKLRMLLYQAGLEWQAGDVLLGCVAILVLVTWLAYERTNVLPVSLLLGIAAGFGPIIYIFRKRRQRFDSFEQRLPEALDLMVGALRAGHSLSSALSLVSKEMADPISKEFRQCVDEQNFGLELRTALTNIVTRVPIPDVRTLVTAILIQRESGGNLAEILEKAAHVIRERFRLRRQVRVHTAQGRLTGWILSLAPLVLGVALYLVNPKHMSILWQRPIGIKMMWGAGISTIIGALIIRKIVNVRI